MQSQAIAQEPSLTSLLAVDDKQLAEQMLEPTTMQAIYEDTEAIIVQNRTPQGLFALVENAIETMEAVWSDLQQEAPAYACRKGCSYCCHHLLLSPVGHGDGARSDLRREVPARQPHG